MGQALYRKHRPKSLNEVVGQQHITQTLQQAIAQGRLSHAYLFTGPKGVGKTSVARILAHQINDLPYTDDSPHMDIIEIDAASNRRIDEIRELRDKVYVAPTSAKYKVYIIDEVHMLTREAFNALLKTLEEPPAHVIFILATTDVHKLPETIISRTQRFNFRPGEVAEVAEHLKRIAKAEKLDVSEAALRLIAVHGEGSFRDSLSLLDQSTNQASQVTPANIESLLGIPSDAGLQQLLALATAGSKPAELMQALANMSDQGYQASEIAKRLGQALRAQIAGNNLSLTPAVTLDLLARLVEVPASHDPEQALEIALLQASPGLARATPIKQPIEPAGSHEAEEEAIPPPKPLSKMPAPPTKASPKPKPGRQAFNAQLWPAVLRELKAQHNTLYSVVRMSQPDFSGDSLTLAFGFGFHQKRLLDSANRQKLIDIIYNLCGVAVQLEAIVDKTAQPPKLVVAADSPPVEPPESTAPTDISAISNIFGKAELLES